MTNLIEENLKMSNDDLDNKCIGILLFRCFRQLYFHKNQKTICNKMVII